MHISLFPSFLLYNCYDTTGYQNYVYLLEILTYDCASG
jgi:hypothetical protein